MITFIAQRRSIRFVGFPMKHALSFSTMSYKSCASAISRGTGCRFLSTYSRVAGTALSIMRKPSSSRERSGTTMGIDCSRFFIPRKARRTACFSSTGFALACATEQIVQSKSVFIDYTSGGDNGGTVRMELMVLSKSLTPFSLSVGMTECTEVRSRLMICAGSEEGTNTMSCSMPYG